MDLEAAVQRVHDALQEALNAGEIRGGGLVAEWYLIGTTTDIDGDTSFFALSDDEARISRSVGLVKTALILLEDEVRQFREDTD